MKLKT